MQRQQFYDEFLHHLGRMLLFRSEFFQETSEICSVMTTDPKGYLAIDLLFVREFFEDSFLELVEECVGSENVPSQPQLLKKLQSRSILAERNPIERYYRRHHSQRRARKQQHAFLLEVAECFPLCLEAVRGYTSAKTAEANQFSGQVASPLISAREAAKRVGVSEKTIRNWARQGKIRAEFTTGCKGRKRLVGIPEDVVSELVTTSGSLPN